ncbi:lytic transglycosylase domain-containing protein [Streptomyces spinosirectus]|jgi:hypothetical protein|uniref:lytic transglycosylase domain-containing protein n=1 Tax=Streptomyces TaxID=1883 RepID=UPI000D3710EF|nr:MULTISPECIES: lytic transglycosylase domain-containing protein [Streptomyces]PTM99546.1 hypothetical protein C7821_102494 [Streptomyces sp. VMFN-G11Ma]UIR17762.1 lytic transglycosylase domain-containing protein [Streptomyces spinosirectus]
MGDEEGGSNTARNAATLAGCGVGCVMLMLAAAGIGIVVLIFCGFDVILAPVILLYMFFHGLLGGGAGGGGGDGGHAPSTAEASSALVLFQGDGRGDLDTSSVPKDLVDPIQNAGKLCDAIGPRVIAAQIDRASDFDASLVRDGKEGISQLPPDIFKKYGKDDDGNGKTSALDAEDSIMAQGRYMCDLAGQAQQMIDANEAVGSVLDLALAGYDVGMDSVRAAKGVPDTGEAQNYVAGVRAQFAKYAGIITLPSGLVAPTFTTTAPPTAVPSESAGPTPSAS